MTLASLLAAHESRTKTLTVYAPAPMAGLEEHFGGPGVEVVHEPVPDDGSGGFVTVEENGEFLGSVPADALRELVAPTERNRPGSGQRNEALGRLFALLRDATFASFDRRKLLGASREFEDRAARVGEGGLHAGFQRPGALREQVGLYESLAAATDLDVHCYLDADWGAPGSGAGQVRPDADADGELPDIDGVTVHAAAGSELGRYWFVLFDGGPDATAACGLLAEQREAGYYGFWTYDATEVNRAVTYLQDTY